MKKGSFRDNIHYFRDGTLTKETSKEKKMKSAFIKLDLQFLDSLPVQQLLHREGAKGVGALIMLFEYLRRCTDCVGVLSAVPHLASKCKMKQTSLFHILHDEELFTILDDDRFYCSYLSKTMNKVGHISDKSAPQLADNQDKSLYIEDRTIVKKEKKKKSDPMGTVADAVPSSDIPEPGEVCTSSDGSMRVIFPDEPVGKFCSADRIKAELIGESSHENIESPPLAENIAPILSTDSSEPVKAYLSEGESLSLASQKDTFEEAKAYLSEGKSIPFTSPRNRSGQKKRGNPDNRSNRMGTRNQGNQNNPIYRMNQRKLSTHLFKQQLCNRQNQDTMLSNPATLISSRDAARDKCAARAPYAETNERTAPRRACPSTSPQALASVSSAEPNSCFKNNTSDTYLTPSTINR